MTARVRPISSSDRKAWEQVWAQYNAFYGRSGDTALAEEIVDTTWRRLLDEGEPVSGVLAEKDGQIVGLAHVVFHLNLIQTAETCYMQDLFTIPAARGSGIGGLLIEAVHGLCRERGVRDIYWHTHRDNLAARRLYDQTGRDTQFVVYRTDVR